MTNSVPQASLMITSTANPRIKAASALRDRGARAETGFTVVDGAREVRRALEAGVTAVEAFVCEPLLAGEDARFALDRLIADGIQWSSVSETVFERVAFGGRAEGLVVVVRAPSTELDDLTLPAEPLLLVIEGVEKPGNIGAVMRTADGAGVDAVIAASPATDVYNPNAIRASAGTIFGLPIATATSGEVLAWLRARGIPVVTTRVDASLPYTEVSLTGPVAIILGGEAEGLTADWTGDDITAVRIPMAGAADSLNVSISAAILAYEARRQRDSRTGGHA